MIVATASSFSEWRETARQFLARDTDPESIVWQEEDSGQRNLFPETVPQGIRSAPLTVPPDFLALMNRVACYRDESKWALLYKALWRMKRGERHLYNLATDPLMHRLRAMDAEIKRDAHKTKAFVRFRRIGDGKNERYVAWHRPDHKVLPLVAPFFQRRFSVMRWSILTPDESVAWDGEHLQTGPGLPAGVVTEDSTEDLWLRYYSATFNPARIKIKMMKSEMPVRHWATLPETKLIPQMLKDAQARVDAMLAGREGLSVTARDFLPAPVQSDGILDYASVKAAAANCRGCELFCDATQTVFGEGALDARIMLVGEQPGDQEDREGRAFIGPAGQVLEQILASIGLERRSLYITNAVKHFKFVPRGKKRIHQAPNAREMNACKPWLFTEIKIIKPTVIVSLGLTAARSLIHQGFSLKHDGEKQHNVLGVPLIATWHPSAILRTPDPDQKAAIETHMVKALRAAERLASKAAAGEDLLT